MNNKIEKLAEQADIIKRPNMLGLGWDYTISEHQLEKFVELIIEECGNIAADRITYIYEEIREHFEVEE
jgi:hypothetical protein